ncbi:MAG: hypothetical protein K2Z25_03960 [Beijerinckiaceae bacterium]|jgi:hypothetical protein|uniref:hypothetical protein n=2 Tax=Bosea sp. (in: a-proteobacteria) TaxID=1871050 RepID=UPI00082F985D|nr:hypothetical protein [Bosea sp. (in: a-proteobacteria)]MBX9907846.1 hypothetical protein [Beijerinckiaceae bacterium]MCZ8350350.1 hypothetical protein [Rhizobium sp.]OYW64732.1 MAG: hypothetical protein B7Z40_13235 [Bosea sp. 12-68-7]OYX00105.1 MAG: hypothetical protein B7Z14_10040 [Bosea sp. 32-68-6]
MTMTTFRMPIAEARTIGKVPRSDTTVQRAKQHHRLRATGVHPYAIGIALAGYAWLIVLAWAAFAGGPSTLLLVIVTTISLMYFGLLVGGGALSRNMTPERETERSFHEFLDGDVDIATGRVSGRDALLQITALPIAAAMGGTAIVLIAIFA